MHGTQAGFVDLLRTRSKSAALREALHGEYKLKMLMYHSTIKAGSVIGVPPSPTCKGVCEEKKGAQSHDQTVSMRIAK
ncbi:hypothetical protein ACUXVY_03150 [Chromobacterium haemolyticum]|uniref:hypothetical protein n=1 Tax=Chromobacterium haemolyticum TaxID=394935 RepID=UPI004056D16C